MTKVGYPVDRIAAFAKSVADSAGDAMDEHDKQWYKILQAIQKFPYFMQDPLTDALSNYSNRLKDSYTWQVVTSALLLTEAKNMEYYDNKLKSELFQFKHPDLD